MKELKYEYDDTPLNLNVWCSLHLGIFFLIVYGKAEWAA